MLQDSKLLAWAQKFDRRACNRVRATLNGKLFVVSDRRELDCVVKNLSPQGAGLRCSTPLPGGIDVILYVTGFGRFEGTTVEPANDGVGIRFECTPKKTKRITEQLTLFVKGGLTAVTSLRGSARIKEAAIQSFTRSNGDVVESEISDVSLTGASLRTRERPPVGEVIRLGRLAGRVVRHHESGISVQFVDETDVD
jgi:PilZ domain-containing protein